MHNNTEKRVETKLKDLSSNNRKVQLALDRPFGSRQNHQIKNFFSLSHEDLPLVMDAFSQSWVKGLLYSFTPFSLFPKVLKRIQQDRAMVILIAPYWPKRSWFLLLLQRARGKSCPLPQVNDLLIKAHNFGAKWKVLKKRGLSYFFYFSVGKEFSSEVPLVYKFL